MNTAATCSASNNVHPLMITREHPPMPALPQTSIRVPPQTEPGPSKTLYYINEINEAPGTPPFLAPRPSSLATVSSEVHR